MNDLHALSLTVTVALGGLAGLIALFLWAHHEDIGRPLGRWLYDFLHRDPQGDNNKEHLFSNWLRLSLYPDFIIGGKSDPYIKRWYLMPRMWVWVRVLLAAYVGLWLHHPWFLLALIGLYLHNIIRSDDDRALHDHPVTNISIVIFGQYTEVVPDWSKIPKGSRITPDSPVRRKVRRAGSIVFRFASQPHRIEITDGPAYSLWLIGPPTRQWGFLCGRGWIWWKDFVGADAGTVGRGCD